MCIDLNHWRIGVINLSRFDRFYVGEAFVLNGGNIKIMPSIVLADHAPVRLRTFGQLKMASIRSRIPENVMLDNRWYIQVRDIW